MVLSGLMPPRPPSRPFSLSTPTVEPFMEWLREVHPYYHNQPVLMQVRRWVATEKAKRLGFSYPSHDKSPRDKLERFVRRYPYLVKEYHMVQRTLSRITGAD